MSPTSPRRRGLRAACALTALGVAVGVPLAASGSVTAHADGRQLQVVDERGDTVVTATLPSSGRFAIDYQHSYYDQPASERFVAGPDGFRVASLVSPSEAVLDYYDVAGTRSTDAEGRHVLVPDASPVLPVLPLIATEKGRRTLVVSGHRTPLWSDGGARHLRLRLAEPGPLHRLLPSP